MKFHSLSFVLGSMLLMLSLFCPLLWNFIPDIDWTFIFYDVSCKCFSWNPIKYTHRTIQDLAPFYFNFILMPVYILSKGLIPEMVVSIGKIKINLWNYHIMYVSLQAIDLFLSYLQFPYYRTAFIVVGLILQVKWLMDE